jgi:hypothetical protein
MTKRQLHHVQKKMIKASLSKQGRCSSKTPHSVVFGPWRHLGIGDWHLCHAQGVGGTPQLLKRVRAGSNLGTFLQTGLDWTQLHTGASFPIFEKMSIA